MTGPGRLPVGRLALLFPDGLALERAVALGRPWGYLAPAGFGLGGLLLLTPLPLGIGKTTLVVGAAALALVYVPLWRRQPADATLVQSFGAVLATGAALLWLGDVPVPWLLPWLVGFLVLTIAGERLELARVASPGPRAESVLTAFALLVATGAVAALLWPVAGHVLLGGALLALTAWLVCLPAVLRRPLPYVPLMYAPVALLHASLILRLAVGDVRGISWAWQTGGALNIAAVLLFVALVVWSAVSSTTVQVTSTTRIADWAGVR